VRVRGTRGVKEERCLQKSKGVDPVGLFVTVTVSVTLAEPQRLRHLRDKVRDMRVECDMSGSRIPTEQDFHEEVLGVQLEIREAVLVDALAWGHRPRETFSLVGLPSRKVLWRCSDRFLLP